MNRRVISILASGALLVGMLGLSTGTVAGRTINSCFVKNGTTVFGPGPGSVLQAAIDAAASGDTLRIRGRCVGPFSVAPPKILSLVGVKGGGYKMATMDGGLSLFGHWLGGQGPDEYFAVRVTLTDLLITGANHGIYTDWAVVTLDGSTRVSGNSGGGIDSHYGVVNLNDASSISGNLGSGIGSFRGTIYMNDSSSITGNVTPYSGGGIALLWSDLTLRGSASITGNTAAIYGGGVDDGTRSGYDGQVKACGTWTGAISPNTPDDPPTPTVISC